MLDARTATTLFLLSLAGCASAPPPAPRVAPAARPEAPPVAEAEPEPSEAPAEPTMSGLTGSLSDVEAHRALDPRMSSFARCFLEHGDGLHQLGGDVRLHIRVGVDGGVVSAYPEDSTVGHREVERCLSEVAMQTRFPRPHGGEARLTWPISMDPPDDVRHPATWDPGRVARLVERRAPEVLARCRPPESSSRIQITAYVRRGRVISAGAAVEDESAAPALDCVVEQVRAWPMPPAARLAKVTFDLEPGATLASRGASRRF